MKKIRKKRLSSNDYKIPKIAQKELTDLLGEKNVCFDRNLLSVYRAGAWGPWFSKTILPHGAVRPKTVEDVQGILKTANKYKIPVVLFSTGFEQTSWQGGLVVDTYSRMNKIHQIDVDSGYALVEPGVTCGQLLQELRPLGYWIPFGSFPPTFSMITTLVCNSAYTNSMGREDDPLFRARG